MDDQIKLYSLLVDQLTKYNAIFWQAPALVIANVAVLDKLIGASPWVTVGLGIFNGAMIYAFGRMTIRQSEITEAAEIAEAALMKAYPEFIPSFRPSPRLWPHRSWRASSRYVLVGTMIALDAWLLIYGLARIFRAL